jgi:DNA-binding protein YbaB
MFDNMRMMGALAGLMKNKDKLKEAGERVKAKAEEMRVTAEAGGGAARATVTGTMRVVAVELTPALVLGMAAEDRTRELAASLIAEAVNAAIKDAQLRMKSLLDEEARGLGIEGGLSGLPGLGGLLP